MAKVGGFSEENAKFDFIPAGPNGEDRVYPNASVVAFTNENADGSPMTSKLDSRKGAPQCMLGLKIPDPEIPGKIYNERIWIDLPRDEHDRLGRAGERGRAQLIGLGIPAEVLNVGGWDPAEYLPDISTQLYSVVVESWSRGEKSGTQITTIVRQD